MDRLEAQAQYRALEHLLGTYGLSHRFNAEDIRHMHRQWLGDIYEWAGEYRRVNLSKGDLPFAAATQIGRLMNVFDREILGTHTPCAGMNAQKLAQALAVVHAELILIHPFRDGNGRVARMLVSCLENPVAFKRRCIPPGVVAPRSRTKQYASLVAPRPTGASAFSVHTVLPKQDTGRTDGRPGWFSAIGFFGNSRKSAPRVLRGRSFRIRQGLYRYDERFRRRDPADLEEVRPWNPARLEDPAGTTSRASR